MLLKRGVEVSSTKHGYTGCINGLCGIARITVLFLLAGKSLNLIPVVQ